MRNFFLTVCCIAMLCIGCQGSAGPRNDSTTPANNFDTSISDDRVIEGIVLDKNRDEILVQISCDSPTDIGEIWFYATEQQMFSNIEVGQMVIVWYDQIRESYPGQANALKIETKAN